MGSRNEPPARLGNFAEARRITGATKNSGQKKPQQTLRFHFFRYLPETLLGQTAPPVQQQAVDRTTGGHSEALRQAFAFGVMQVIELGLAGAFRKVFIAGLEFVDQVFVQRRNTEPDFAGGDFIDRQLRAIARHEVLEQLMGCLLYTSDAADE